MFTYIRITYIEQHLLQPLDIVIDILVLHEVGFLTVLYIIVDIILDIPYHTGVNLNNQNVSSPRLIRQQTTLFVFKI